VWTGRMGSLVNRIVLGRVAAGRPSALARSVVGLEVVGRVSGRRYRFPVQYAAASDGQLVVVPGRPDRKTWWRNIAPAATPVRVLRRGRWEDGIAERLGPGDPAYDVARATYLSRWPSAALSTDQPVVVLRSGNPGGSSAVEPVD
jgi:deazaflavin-dependent oxidoreductase (nitroreductase family)